MRVEESVACFLNWPCVNSLKHCKNNHWVALLLISTIKSSKLQVLLASLVPFSLLEFN